MWQYWNPNPVRQSRTGDCVIRAIAKVTGKSWNDVYRDLCKLGEEMGDGGNENVVWRRYLKEMGFRQYAIPNSCPDCYSVEDFARDHQNGEYILATGAHGGDHAIAIVDGDWWDAWDSGGEVPILFFRR